MGKPVSLTYNAKRSETCIQRWLWNTAIPFHRFELTWLSAATLSFDKTENEDLGVTRLPAMEINMIAADFLAASIMSGID